MVKILRAYINVIDRFTKWQGMFFCWLIFPLVFSLCYEIISRFFFNSPTIWVYDTTYMLFGSLCFLGGAYTLLVEGHVRVDFFYGSLSSKNRSIVEVINYILFFFPMMSVCLYYGAVFFWQSWIIKEHGSYGIWAPIIYPYRAIIPISILLLLLQGVAKFINNILYIFNRGEKS
ncbi:hypothetical protein ES705_41102 [subsurface metagenome]